MHRLADDSGTYRTDRFETTKQPSCALVAPKEPKVVAEKDDGIEGAQLPADLSER